MALPRITCIAAGYVDGATVANSVLTGCTVARTGVGVLEFTFDQASLSEKGIVVDICLEQSGTDSALPPTWSVGAPNVMSVKTWKVNYAGSTQAPVDATFTIAVYLLEQS